MKEYIKEAKKRYGDSIYDLEAVDAFIKGVEYQAEKSYSEEDMKMSFEAGKKGYMRGSYLTKEYYFTWKNFKSWFEQFKKEQ